MGLLGIAKVCYRVTFEAVGTTLKQDKFGFCVIDIGLNSRPGLLKIDVTRAGLHRDIELGATRPSFAGLLGGARARVQVAAILMDIREDKVWVIFETVEHAVAVMRVDIDVGYALHAVFLAQVFGGNTAIIEDAKPGRTISASVMQSRYRHERALCPPFHDCVHSRQRSANDIGGGIKYTRQCGSVPIIKKALAVSRHARNLVDVVGGMEQHQVINTGICGRSIFNCITKIGCCQLVVENTVSIKAKRMRITEAVTGESVTPVN